MHFNPMLDVELAPAVLDRFLSIIGPDPWIRRYRSLHDQMRVNPLLASYLGDSHGLELRLGQLLAENRAPDFSDHQDYTLFSFIAPVVLSYERLTDLGRNRVAGALRDGLNTDRGLRPFKSEIETATHLMLRGFDVSFQDIDRGSGFDFLAVRDRTELEIECKSASGDLGRQVHRRRMMELSWQVWPVIRQALASVEGGRLGRVVLSASLHGRREILREIAGVIGSALQTETSLSTEQCSVEWRQFEFAGTPFEHADPGAVTLDSVQGLLEREIGHANHHVFVGFRPGRSAVALVVESRKPDRVVRGLMHDLKTSAKTQFTKQRPGVLVVQFLELSAAGLLNLASHDSTDPRKAPALQIATNLFFENPDRAHIHTLIYRAQSTLHVSVSVSEDRIDRSYQEQGPTYFFRNPNNPLRDDSRYSLFAA